MTSNQAIDYIQSPDDEEVLVEDEVFYEYEEEDEDEELVLDKLKKKYPCHICDAELATPSSLKYHIRSHTGERPHKCPHCDYAANASFQLKYHIRTHTKEKPYACANCEYRTACSRSLKNHKRIHTNEKPYSCNQCEYKARSAGTLRLHKTVHLTEKNFSCSQCNYRGKTKLLLRSHMRIHEDTPSYLKSKAPRPRLFSCPYCPYRGKSPSFLETHMTTHTGDTPFVCTYCNLKVSSSVYLKKHLMTHTGERPFKCRFCDYSAAQSYTLTTHERNHTGERPFVCQTCGEGFILGKYLKTHILKKHTIQPRQVFPCFICDDSLSTPQEWNEHLGKHVSGDLLYKCTECAYLSSNRGSLERHKSLKHCPKPQKPWKCSICPKKYIRRRQLVRHIQTHNIDPDVDHEKTTFLSDEPVFENHSENPLSAVLVDLQDEKEDSYQEICEYPYGGEKIFKLEPCGNGYRLTDLVDGECKIPDATLIHEGLKIQPYDHDEPVRTLTITEDGEIIDSDCDENVFLTECVIVGNEEYES